MRITISLICISLLLGVTDVFSQAPGPALGDEFIFFVDSPNVLVPSIFRGPVVADPVDPTNFVMQFMYGNWAFRGFQFVDSVGVDLSQNRADGDVLHLRLLVDPSNQGQEKVQLLWEDKTDGSGTSDGTADIPFRLVWRVPEHYRDGNWHRLQIPLPPATYQELEDAKMSGTLDTLSNYWKYAGGWSSGGFGVGLVDEAGPNTNERPELWQEFEWSNVWRFGFHWDHNTGGGNVYFDDVYIGPRDMDLSPALEPPGPMSGVVFATSEAGNRLSWEPIQGYGSYNVYASLEPIIDVEASDVALLASVPYNAPRFGILHRFPLIHPSLAPGTIYYAVTSLSLFSVENQDISQSSGELTDPFIPTQTYITELTDEEGWQLQRNLGAGNVSREGFPDWLEPFVVDRNHSRRGDGGLPESDEDLSGKVWAGYVWWAGFEATMRLYIYAEVTDDQVTVAPQDTPPSEAWRHDSIEFGWGNYDVRDPDGGSTLIGSPHTDMLRGEFADYSFRISGHGDGTKDGTTAHAFVGWSLDAEPLGGRAAYDLMTDGTSVTGWKVLAVFPLDEIQNFDQMDAVLPPPLGTDIRFIPFNIALNDGDGAERDTQIQWSIKDNANPRWWRNPSQWMTVAMAGRLTVASSERNQELPEVVTLVQNYPNPFNSGTAIQFTLPRSEHVSMHVYDTLGRSVGTLLQNEFMSSGTHIVRFDARGLATGVYLYRLEAGGTIVASRKMLVMK